MSAADLDAFWHQCRQDLGLSDEVRWRTRRLGDSPEICALLVELIRTGRKTGTFSLLAEFEETGRPPPQAGEFLVITNYDGQPGCCVRLETVECLPFERVDEAWVQVEGPSLRELGPWREIHEQYWTQMLGRWGRSFTREIPVLCQRFGPPHVPRVERA
ncbi:MAG TPA: ASCH domain-containing protein [Steroidobacteraceae bacterium]|nr:ASCH domain-containing protein [Steroidobacteraceae bacterium]